MFDDKDLVDPSGTDQNTIVLVVTRGDADDLRELIESNGWQAVAVVPADAAAKADAIGPCLILLRADEASNTPVMRSLGRPKRGARAPLVVIDSQPSDEARWLDRGADSAITTTTDRDVAAARLRAAMRHGTELAELARRNRALDDLVGIDPLTDLPNRRRLDQQLRTLEAIAKRRDEPIGVLIIDIDHFKRCNDTHGHEFGDEVLRRVSETLRRDVRTHEIVGRPPLDSAVGRWGGDEFVIGAIGTDDAQLRILAHRIRAAVSQLTIVPPEGGAAVAVTVSIGAASAVGEPWPELLRRADLDLLASKQAR